MKHKFLILLASLFLAGSTTWNAINAETYTITSGKTIYLDATNLDWSKYKLRIGHSKYVSAYSFTQIGSSNLYYYKHSGSDWSGADAFTISDNQGWTGDNTIYQPYNDNGTIKPNGEYTISNQLVYQKYNVSGNILLTATDKGNISNGCQYWNTSKTSLSSRGDLNMKQTLKVMLSTNGGNSYSEITTGAWPGTFSVNRYTLQSSDYVTLANSDKVLSNETDKTYASASVGTQAVFTGSAATGNIFKGWGTSASATPNGETSYTYDVMGENIIYAFIMLDTKNLVVVSEDDDKGIVTGSVSDIATFNNPYTITATPKDGYVFDKWVVTNGEIEYAEGTNETDATAQINISDNVGVKATFKAPLTIYFVPSTEDAATDSYHYNVNLKYTSSEDKWKNGNMTKVEDALYHCRPIYKFETEFTSKDYPIGYIQFQTYDGTTFKHQTEITSITSIAGWQGKLATAGGNVSDYTTETCFDLTIASADNTKGGVSKTSIATYPNNKTEITATPQYGYLFDKWVGSDGVSFDDETKATTNVFATKAGTVTATFKDGPLEAGVWTQWKDKVFPSTQFMRVKSTDHVAVATVDIIDATKTYDFKYSKLGGNWYGNTGYITPATTFETWWSFENISGKSEHDQAYYWCHIQPSGVGTLTIKINLDEDRIYVSMPYDLKITSAGYASFYGENNLTIPDGLMVQYMTEASEESITWEPLTGIIPMHTGVILSGEPGTYTAFTTTNAGTAAAGNLLLGTDEQKEIAANGKPHYVLSNGEFGVGMYFPNFATVDDKTGIGAFTNGAHKAYLELEPIAGVSPRCIPFIPRQTPTQMKEQTSSVVAQKVLIDGKLYIRQGEQMFNTQGQIIK